MLIKYCVFIFSQSTAQCNKIVNIKVVGVFLEAKQESIVTETEIFIKFAIVESETMKMIILDVNQAEIPHWKGLIYK